MTERIRLRDTRASDRMLEEIERRWPALLDGAHYFTRLGFSPDAIADWRAFEKCDPTLATRALAWSALARMVEELEASLLPMTLAVVRELYGASVTGMTSEAFASLMIDAAVSALVSGTKPIPAAFRMALNAELVRHERGCRTWRVANVADAAVANDNEASARR